MRAPNERSRFVSTEAPAPYLDTYATLWTRERSLDLDRGSARRAWFTAVRPAQEVGTNVAKRVRMAALFDQVKMHTEKLRQLRESKSPDAAVEAALLQELATAMVREESCFDPAHGTARILGATDDRGEVRLTVDGAWKVGASPEKDLLAIWDGADDCPTLDEVLEGVQRNFSSARIGNLVAEVREALATAPAKA